MSSTATLTNDDVQAAAVNAANCGISVLPIELDGSKRPSIAWKHLQRRRLTLSEIERHYSNPRGLAVICGQVSGGLEMFEFESGYVGARGAARMVQLAHRAGYSDLMGTLFHGYSELSASGGLHLLYRCPDPRTIKIARDAAGKTVCETKGEGGYVITAPTPAAAHPTSRHGWTLEHGGFDTIPTITCEERALLFAFARLALTESDETIAVHV